MEHSKQNQFLELYEPVHKQLSKYCRAISGNADDAKDLMNDAILVALENFDNIKDKDAFKSYIFSIASNLNKMRFRKSKFKAHFNEMELAQIIDKSSNPEYETEFRIIYEKMLALPAKTSETLIMFHISDMSLDEIQKIQGGSLSGVKLRLMRGREQLLKSLTTSKQMEFAILFLTI